MSIDREAISDITYNKSFVAFLDVLGFKNMINSHDLTKINKYFGVVNSAISYLKGIESKKEIGSIIISDSIVLTVPCTEDNDENIDKLRQLCIAVGLIQQNLAIEGIWLRGAISYGDTYFNAEENQIVGPAYINAYLLEEQQAINPRVILDVKLVHQLQFKNATQLIYTINKAFEDGLKYRNWGRKILFECLLLDEKHSQHISHGSPLFIDYLSPLLESQDWDSAEKVINNVKNSMYMNNRVYGKFRWVADYIHILVKRELEEGCEVDSVFQCKLIDF